MRTEPRQTGAVSLVLTSALAFFRRELATYASYRAKLALGLASLVLSLVTFSFVGRVVSCAGSGFIEHYGMSYSSFAVVGIFVHSLASSGLHSFRSAVRREQLQGTLELLLTTRLPTPVLVLLAGAGELAITVLGGALLMAGAAALIGLNLRLSPSLVAALGLYLLVMCGAGLASAGVIMVSKEGEPISWAVSGAAGLLGGVYFPVDMLPRWLQAGAGALPTTHALAVARYGAGCAAATGSAGSLLFLAVAAGVSLAAGLAVLEWGCRRARSSGTLGHY
ncbi:MAG: ABC transporter permease [Candidatus Eisenbacteria bacterium]